MLDRLVADRFLKCLERLEHGALDLTLPDGRSYSFAGRQPGPRASMILHDWRVPLNLARRGDTGLAADYRDGFWESDSLENLVAIAILNEKTARPFVWSSGLFHTLNGIFYKIRDNTLRGSRRNIQAHYDLGNDFYRLWLDPTMTYSSGIFSGADGDLVQAQLNKYDRIIGRLGASSGSLLEVGCGWGGFAERACAKGDFGVKGITLSDEQYHYASERVGGDAVIALEDYRIQEGKFDNIVSIEMFEAVGERYWQTYFGKISALLNKGGRALIQTITIDDNRFAVYRRGNDFIRSFIFPGGMLPSPSVFAQEAARAGLRVHDRFDFGHDYATTLDHWLQTFERRLADVRALGYDEGFIRLWRFYLAGCIAGFRTGCTNVMQVELRHA